MKDILIDGEIGYDWWSDSGATAESVRKQLEGLADGEDVQITLNSPGGSVYEGVVIFNLIRETAKTHSVSVRINCMAMSMASYIALAARTVDKTAKVTVSDNSLLMIHNPWTVTYGDYRDLKKEADYLEKLAVLYGSVHTYVSGRPDADIRKAMDEETYYVGREILDAGFANDFEAIGNDADFVLDAPGARDALIINAKLRFDKAVEKAYSAQNKKELKNDLRKAAALLPCGSESRKAGDRETKPAGSPIQGVKMNPEDLLAKDKACYDAVFALGVARERARVQAHIVLGKKSGAMDIALKHIENGKSTLEEDVHAEYVAASMDRNRIDARNEDDPENLRLPGGREESDAVKSAFWRGMQGKDAKGDTWQE
jgi:ATP-dependent protease ClpP protease subunit